MIQDEIDQWPPCSFCNNGAIGFHAPIYIIGKTKSNWVTRKGGDAFYYCANHFLESASAKGICEEIGEDIPITNYTLILIKNKVNSTLERTGRHKRYDNKGNTI